MYPSRPAPSPPRTHTLPPNHPFSTHVASNQYTSFNASMDSFQTTRTAPSPPSTPSSYRRARSPTANLAKPLSPTRVAHNLGHHSIYQSPKSYRSDRAEPTSPTPTPLIPLPIELTLFDPRPRQTLLRDVEYILGKKLHFPFIRRVASNTDDDKKTKKTKDHKEKRGRRLRKEKEYDLDDWASWDVLDEMIVRDDVILSEQGSAKGRQYKGVKGGNWI
ncbi:hypothetical protein CI109_100195 [Kwoniella shandongensis]|uniref:Uncharacterized protein n=1 Tax=Kwoniella shandongensis TaxID=1734106 RepID=A0A5M6BUM5_9TREE|nr:uncharacterized protein CI109_005794 [Kwoniella shandongensis]KAA5525911.1 hypothetical protein CI109_005794 [Kwoniella shandongensis]